MVGHLTRVLGILVFLAPMAGFAQALSDPTRPPRELLEGGDSLGPEPGSSPAQVVIISSDRREATINGKTVPLGGRYGEATLVQITDDELVLKKADSTEVIRLYSLVNRKMQAGTK
jgi:MSHA biogenesis protein MshK